VQPKYEEKRLYRSITAKYSTKKQKLVFNYVLINKKTYYGVKKTLLFIEWLHHMAILE